MKHLNIWEELAEDVIAILGDSFKVLLCLRLLKRSPELPTAATPEALFADVCETLVRDNFAKLKAFRTEKFGACHMTGDEVAAIAEPQAEAPVFVGNERLAPLPAGKKRTRYLEINGREVDTFNIARN